VSDLAAESCGPEIGAHDRPVVKDQSERSLIPIGYWHSEDADGLPHPQSLVSWTWQFGRRWRIIRYLRIGSEHIQPIAQVRIRAELPGVCQVGGCEQLDGVLKATPVEVVKTRLSYEFLREVQRWPRESIPSLSPMTARTSRYPPTRR
jgi:hypothetical protein